MTPGRLERTTTMRKYGQAALEATQRVVSGRTADPRSAWDLATARVFGSSASSQEKCCPRNAYLGCCEDGLVRGVPRGSYTRSAKNKTYAVTAVDLLKRNPSTLTLSEMDLWRLVLKHLNVATDKTPNDQMDVVLSLFRQGLIV